MLLGVSLGLFVLMVVYLSLLRRGTETLSNANDQVVQSAGKPITVAKVPPTYDHTFVEPETVIVNPSFETNYNIDPIEPCQFDSTNPWLLESRSSNTESTFSWSPLGQDLNHAIKESATANAAGDDVWSNHYGYGNRIALSGDGNLLALSFAGLSGKDKAFGTHIDVFRKNETHWDLMDTLTDVTRGHGHLSHAVHFQSLQMSRNGRRIAFADGHGGVHVAEQYEGSWSMIAPIVIPSLTNASHHQFGTDLAMNCDGSVIAVSGTSPRHSFTQLFRLENWAWTKIGEIKGKKFGASIALSADGTRFVMGTVASESWRGLMQVYDFDGSGWNRVGQPIVGTHSLEMFAGSVDISADGSIVVGTSKDGNAHRVAAFQLSKNGDEWQPFGQELQGSGNPHEHFGTDVKLSSDGSVLAVGAPGDLTIYKALLKEDTARTIPDNDIPYQRGQVYLYRISDGEWERIDQGILQGTTNGDLFGKVVALSSDGATVSAGAPIHKGKSYQHFLGSAKTYRIDSAANP